MKRMNFIKIFRNNSGDASFFPTEDDIEANQKFLDEFPDTQTK